MVTLRKHLLSLGLSFCQIKQSCLILFITADVSANLLQAGRSCQKGQPLPFSRDKTRAARH